MVPPFLPPQKETDDRKQKPGHLHHTILPPAPFLQGLFQHLVPKTPLFSLCGDKTLQAVGGTVARGVLWAAFRGQAELCSQAGCPTLTPLLSRVSVAPRAGVWRGQGCSPKQRTSSARGEAATDFLSAIPLGSCTKCCSTTQ